MLTEAVADSPAAVGIELMNEPPILNFRVEEHKLYDLYKECYDAVRAVSDEMAVGVADAGQIPKFTSDEHLSRSNKEWLEEATHLMYTFHWYSSGFPEFDPAMANGVARAKYFDAVPVRHIGVPRGGGRPALRANVSCAGAHRVPLERRPGSRRHRGWRHVDLLPI